MINFKMPNVNNKHYNHILIQLSFDSVEIANRHSLDILSMKMLNNYYNSDAITTLSVINEDLD